jgi:hypothetical protein
MTVVQTLLDWWGFFLPRILLPLTLRKGLSRRIGLQEAT